MRNIPSVKCSDSCAWESGAWTCLGLCYFVAVCAVYPGVDFECDAVFGHYPGGVPFVEGGEGRKGRKVGI